MRTNLLWSIAIAALIAAASLLQGCAQIAAKRAAGDANACLQANKASSEGQLLYARLWANDAALDTADKLTDPKPLTKDERNALVRYHANGLPCRQIVVAHDTQYAAWELPYWQQFFERTDAIYVKLAAGELGAANRLSIESNGKFQTDISQGHAEAVRFEEIQQQQAAQAMIQASAVMVASQPRPTMTTTNCTWLGNQLNCTSLRQ